ncbi:hypothetical protein HKBW3S09_01282 [Candidatus Hakubella thermalkaliphila]|uniref:Uncharacterized protein n=1 Tax=Candidatus Hakubella thermalkaliphila TaxID=2754717 RepID=A0A6V8NUK8_9ACTN|nr:hypothetical protein [Candidatus Hakubella thermalkaliphila]GFP23817.1 hypothetical protein HKBW3S09_01282 [Candidatus Hakubella thermalkaliphila]GFP29986.1 hypothetical protein HKBW3S34_00906 [Candidatus Hakubella thermalkaliphila]
MVTKEVIHFTHGERSQAGERLDQTLLGKNGSKNPQKQGRDTILFG